MESENKYRVVAWWNAGKTGLAKCDSAPNAIHFAAPPQFGGLEGRWSPEDLLLSAIAGCFTTTFRVLADYSQFEYIDLEVQVEGVVCKVRSGYEFGKILVQPKLTISNANEQALAEWLLGKANRLCLISRSISIPLTFEPKVCTATTIEALGTSGRRDRVHGTDFGTTR